MFIINALVIAIVEATSCMFNGVSGECLPRNQCEDTFTPSSQGATGCEELPNGIDCCTVTMLGPTPGPTRTSSMGNAASLCSEAIGCNSIYCSVQSLCDSCASASCMFCSNGFVISCVPMGSSCPVLLSQSSCAAPPPPSLLTPPPSPPPAPPPLNTVTVTTTTTTTTPAPQQLPTLTSLPPPPTVTAAPPSTTTTTTTTTAAPTMTSSAGLATPTSSPSNPQSSATDQERTASSSTTTLSVFVATSSAKSSPLSIGVIIGVALGALCCLLLIAIVIGCIVRQQLKVAKEIHVYNPAVTTLSTMPAAGFQCMHCANSYPSLDDLQIHVHKRHGPGAMSAPTITLPPSQYAATPRYEASNSPLGGFYATNNSYEAATSPMGGNYDRIPRSTGTLSAGTLRYEGAMNVIAEQQRSAAPSRTVSTAYIQPTAPFSANSLGRPHANSLQYASAREQF